MAERRVAENPLALAVLSYLTQRPMHPYELSKTLRDHHDDRSFRFTHGSLYTVVGRLEKAGLVEAGEPEREGRRPERTVYSITVAGRAELHERLRALVAEPEHEYPGFVAALSLIAALPPDEVVELLGRRLAALADTRSDIEGTLALGADGGVHPLFLMEEEYRLTLADAEIRFVEGFVARITDPDDGWGPLWARFHEQAPTEGDAT